MRMSIFIILLIMAVPRAGVAFNYEEHCRMSNHALLVAASMSRVTGAQRETLHSLVEAARASRCAKSHPSRAYGDLVARVDWAFDPADFFLSHQGPLATDSIPIAAIQRLLSDRVQEYAAVHNNREHFARHALFAFHQLRERALAVAGAGNLELALVYSAFADHYLEDLFAPGHVYAPRAGVNDPVAGGMHNHYNVRGAFFLARDMDALAALVPPAVPEGLDSLRRKVCQQSDLKVCIGRMDATEIPFFGDNQLFRSPAQEIFVTMTIARGLSELIDTWLGQAEPPLYDEVTWCGYVRTNEDEPWTWSSPRFQIPNGGFVPEEGTGLPRLQGWSTVRLGYGPADGRGDFVSLSLETLWKALPRDWLGDDDAAGRIAGAIRPDRTTHRGIDVVGRTGSGFVRSLAAGPFVRWSWWVNGLDARGSFILGARATPGHRTAEIHFSPAFEFGAGLAHLEARPTVELDTRGRLGGGLLLALSATRGRQAAPGIGSEISYDRPASAACAGPVTRIRSGTR